MRRQIWMGVLATVVALGVAQPVAAQQTVNFSFGGFTVRGEDARTEGDILNQNLTYLTFDVKDFNGPTIGGEWLLPFGQFFEGGIGVSLSRRTVPSVYTDFVDLDGSEIEQELKLRVVPVALTVRMLPLGQVSAVQPYFGVGLGLFNWRYSESGDFVDFSQGNVIFREQFVSTGTEAGPLALAGVRFAGDTLVAGGEVRFQSAEGKLGGDFIGVSDDPRVDLGGWSYLATVGIRFGR